MRTLNLPLIEVLTNISNERIRQVDEEGFDSNHDDKYRDAELVCAAVCYAITGMLTNEEHKQAKDDGRPPDFWPWDNAWWKPSNPRRDLVKAAALIVAEIQRLDRETKPDV